MEFNLFKDQEITFDGYSGYIIDMTEGVSKRMSRPIAINMAPVVQDSESANLFSDLMINSLIENKEILKDLVLQKQECINPNLRVYFAFSSLPSDNGHGGYIQLSNGREDIGVCIFQRLWEVYGCDGLKIRLKVEDFTFENSEDTKFNFEKTIEMSGEQLDDMMGCGLGYGCQFNQVPFPWKSWPFSKSNGRVTVTLIVNDSTVNTLYLEKFSKKELIFGNKHILTEQLHYSDFVIVAPNGAEIQCHKVILAAVSVVFDAMFKTKMKEKTNNRLVTIDMTEEGIRALLKFVYYGDLKKASANPDMALELFKAGHKYSISLLETAMTSLICAKSNNWFNVDMTVKLMLFVDNFNQQSDIKDDLLKKTVNVLRWVTKTSPAQIMQSEEYNKVFQNPNLAIKFSMLLLSH